MVIRYMLDTDACITKNVKEFKRVPDLKIENWEAIGPK